MIAGQRWCAPKTNGGITLLNRTSKRVAVGWTFRMLNSAGPRTASAAGARGGTKRRSFLVKMKDLNQKRKTPMSNIPARILLFVLTALLVAVFCGSAVAQQHITGTLPDGATYVIDVPANWNGTLLLYSHGYVGPGSPNPAQDVGDPFTGGFMLAAGYALAGSSYATTGWAVHEAIPDQIAVLDVFQNAVGTPTKTIAWGHSLGGMITAGLVQEHPDRFNAALPMCGVVGGGVGLWNEALDGAFAFNTLLAGGALLVVHITNPTQNFIAAEAILAAAQATPQGRARLALVAALADVPGWFDPTSPEPARTDYATQQANQFLWLEFVDLPFQFAFRAELEFRAGGNPSFNTGVGYERQLAHSADNAEVQALYAAAGLSLDADLRRSCDPEVRSANRSRSGRLDLLERQYHLQRPASVPRTDAAHDRRRTRSSGRRESLCESCPRGE